MKLQNLNLLEERGFQTALQLVNQKAKRVQFEQKRSQLVFEAGQVVKLNVGGVFYETTLSTLQRYRGSFLADLFSEDFSGLKQPDGSVFFDRSGKTFEFVLQFLRNPDTTPKLTKTVAPLVLEEARFFGIN